MINIIKKNKIIKFVYIFNINKNIYINNNFEFILDIDSWVKFVDNIKFTYK